MAQDIRNRVIETNSPALSAEACQTWVSTGTESVDRTTEREQDTWYQDVMEDCYALPDGGISARSRIKIARHKLTPARKTELKSYRGTSTGMLTGAQSDPDLLLFSTHHDSRLPHTSFI